MFKKITDKVVQFIGRVHWKQRHAIFEDDKKRVREILTSNYCIALTRRSNHLSTYFISLGHFLLTGKFGFWSHSLMNVEDEVNDPSDFRLIEALGTGTRYSTFESVFGTVDAVALLKPKGITIEEWTSIMDTLKMQLGKPYDTMFDIMNSNKISCVELVRLGLQSIDNYSERFAAFERMIASKKNLTPQMFYDCPDFEVYYAVRR